MPNFDIVEEIYLDSLTKNSVSVVKNRYLMEGSSRQQIGDNVRCAFMNSALGRRDLAAYIEDPYLGAVLAVWGAEPTVDEPIPQEPDPNETA